MGKSIKTIGVLTSGGDSQGMNAAIYAATRYALSKGIEVLGIDCGYKGLIEGSVRPLTDLAVDNIIHRGGTVLKTSRCLEMKTEVGQVQASKTLEKYGIDGLVVIGGDGSFQGAKVLSTNFNVLTVGIPGTIDNDLAYTDYTLGFDSAVNTVMNTIKMLRDTMSANDRSCVVEVMGRNCGDIALYAGITSGAEMVLVPEVRWSLGEVVDKLDHNLSVGKYDNIIVVAEGTGHADELVANIRQSMKINIRAMVVGHLQRGGDASFNDRLLGARMGEKAIECILEGKSSRVVGIRDSKIIDVDIIDALAQRKSFNYELYNLANQLSKYGRD